MNEELHERIDVHEMKIQGVVPVPLIIPAGNETQQDSTESLGLVSR